MTVLLLIVHSIFGLIVLGAITHQFVSVFFPTTSTHRNFLAHFRSVRPDRYTNAIAIMFLLNFTIGAFLYPPYRLEVKPSIIFYNMHLANAVFELKEHWMALAFGLLPAYVVAWRSGEGLTTLRKGVTGFLMFTVLWGFIIGDILNNIGGLR